jgi:HPt (histidine-containing phosphotransfer) domain-containing protein
MERVDMVEADVKSSKRISAPPLAPAEASAERGIDLAHLSRMTLGEKSLEAEVLALFDRQAGILLGRMRQARPAAVGAFAHTLKGSARGIGAWQVAAAAETLERLAAEPSPGDLADVLDRLADAVDEARAAIADLLAAR